MLRVIAPMVVAIATVIGLTTPAWADAPNGDPNANPNPNCTLLVPGDPRSAGGLATPYELTATDPAQGPCHEANPNQSAFVEAAILDPNTGQISIYRPLVIDKGTQPAAEPVPVTLSDNAVVGIWFGYNGDQLTLDGPGVTDCINGRPGSIFGQFAYCGAQTFFGAAHQAIKSGKLQVPPIGTGNAGLPCPTTRDFSIIDQDQSDNTATVYRALPDGRTAQDSDDGRATGAVLLSNGSDEGLIAGFIYPAIGCQPWTAPDLTDGGSPVPALALNELQAAEQQAPPAAIVPENDPMTLVNNQFDQDKTELYRIGVDQGDAIGQSPKNYCKDLVLIGGPRLLLDARLTSVYPSPDPAAANSLFLFLAARMMNSFENLQCANLLGINNPITVQRNNVGVIINANIAAGTVGGIK